MEILSGDVTLIVFVKNKNKTADLSLRKTQLHFV